MNHAQSRPAHELTEDGPKLVPTLLFLILAAILGTGGYYVYSHQEDRRAADRAVEAVVAQDEADRTFRHEVNLAVAEGRLIPGMNRWEVVRVMGEPFHRVPRDQLGELAQKAGATELWGFEVYGKPKWVVFGADGTVLRVSPEMRGQD